jgi:hypothetical protein
MLAAMLGLPAALKACRQKVAQLPEGEIVGASHEFGHSLRDWKKIEVPAGAWQYVGAAIIGGGIAGLAAAWRFLREGFEDFVLLELEQVPGGTSRSGDSHITSYPWGAHYIPVPMKENRALLTLLDEMGVLEGRTQEGEPIVAEQFLCRDPQERIFYKGRWYEGLYLRPGASQEDLSQLEAFNAEMSRWATWRDSRGRRAFAIPIASCSDDAEVTQLDKISMAEWLDLNGFTSERLRWLVDYACRDDYGLKAEQTSAWAGLFYFASRLAGPGQPAQPLITWPEGNGRLVSHLYAKTKSHVRLGVAAYEIMPTDQGADIIATDRAGRAFGFRARHVIFAAPHFLTRYLIRPYREDPPQHVFEFEYGAWMVANLFLKDRPASRGFPLAWDNVLYESESLGYVVATHQRGLDHGPTIFTYYHPLCGLEPRIARAKLLSASWRECAELVLTDLERAHPDIRFLVERIDVIKWGHAMIRPRPGFIWGGTRRAAIRPYRNIHFANTDLSGVALFEEAFYHGLRAAEEVLSARGHKFQAMI